MGTLMDDSNRTPSTPDFTPEEAQAHTEQIRQCLAQGWQLVTTAYQRRAWAALGYDNWDQYCYSEFKGACLSLPQEERTHWMRSLRAQGLSTRAIGSAVGVSHETVRKTVNIPLTSRVNPAGAETAGQPATLRESLTPDHPSTRSPQRVTGTDGRTYLAVSARRTTPTAPPPVVTDIAPKQPDVLDRELLRFQNVLRTQSDFREFDPTNLGPRMDTATFHQLERAIDTWNRFYEKCREARQ
jgi:hypothetical protein